MQKIKITLDFLEAQYLQNAINNIDLDERPKRLEDKISKSILLGLRSKFILKQKQKNYSKKLHFHEVYAVSRLISACFLMENKRIQITGTSNLPMVRLGFLSVLQSKFDKHL